ncbi:MAG TPA: LLM class flavin-dependent oxidoreductase [Spirillospora sp.]|nr:LLM class flavin-dependent oxidoreductase [Spirillospora sp.]
MVGVRFGWNVPTASPEYVTGEVHAARVISALDAVHEWFDSVWVYDHFHAPPFFDADDYPRLEAWTTTAYLARAFPNLYFGNMVLGQSYRNPALLAKMAATLQALTGGKVILAIGAGWMESEYHAYGYDFPRASVRIAQLEEAVQIIRLMWTEKRATFEGKHYQVRGALCEPKPNPVPPIMIGGNGEQLTLRVVARHADWWNGTGLNAGGMARKLDVLRSHCDREGRDYDEIVKTFTGIISIAETEGEAKRIAQASPRRDRMNFVGTPAQVIEQMQPYVDLGVSYFMLDFSDFPDPAGARLFASEVMPAFR